MIDLNRNVVYLQNEQMLYKLEKNEGVNSEGLSSDDYEYLFLSFSVH